MASPGAHLSPMHTTHADVILRDLTPTETIVLAVANEFSAHLSYSPKGDVRTEYCRAGTRVQQLNGSVRALPRDNYLCTSSVLLSSCFAPARLDALTLAASVLAWQVVHLRRDGDELVARGRATMIMHGVAPVPFSHITKAVRRVSGHR